MRRGSTALFFAGLVLGAAAFTSSATAQKAMLEPPKNKYFVGKGSWGQDYADQWGLHRIGFDGTKNSAWRLVRRDAAPVTVAVIDTGLDWNHRNFAWDSLWRNPKEEQDNGIDDDGNGHVDDVVGWDFVGRSGRPWDNDGHGTFVAGIIAADWNDKDGMAGVSPHARIMVVKGVSDLAKTRFSYVAQAITYAADQGARVINLSLAGRTVSPLEKEAIDYAYAKGAVIVAAAGNEGIENTDHSFRSNEKLLTVASTDTRDERAPFSNWGGISVAAPGVDILSLRARRTDILLGLVGQDYTAGNAFVGQDNRYYRASGTSFSAPLVAGLASLMIANNPKLTNRQVIDIIRSTARDVGTPGVDQFTGYGIIDARAALRAPADYRVLAGITGVQVVATAKGGQAVRVTGTADANQLAEARLEIGAGEAPKKWTRIATIRKPVAGPDSVIGDIPAQSFAGSSVWQIRVVVRHRDGRTREARFQLSLG